jgi:SAM-dependent methyltransferase
MLIARSWARGMQRDVEDVYAAVEERHPWFVARRELFASFVEGQEDARILDIGCGTGAFLRHLVERGFSRLSGVEPSEGLRARFRLSEARHFTEMPDEEFDAIFMLDVLEHLDDDRGMLEGVRERLRPGGRFLFSVPAHPFLWSRHDERNLHRRRYRRAELESKLGEAGLRILKLSYWNMFALPPLALVRLFGMTRSRNELELGGGASAALYGRLLALENALVRRVDLPIGVSLVGQAEKPSAAAAAP